MKNALRHFLCIRSQFDSFSKRTQKILSQLCEDTYFAISSNSRADMKFLSLIILLTSFNPLSAQETPAPSGQESGKGQSALKQVGNKLKATRSEREENLEAIIAIHQKHYSEGVGGMNDLIEAKLQLLEFRLEGESSAPRKLPLTEKILELETQRHAAMESLFRSGHGSQLDFLKSKERLLVARQAALKLKRAVLIQKALQQSKENN